MELTFDDKFVQHLTRYQIQRGLCNVHESRLPIMLHHRGFHCVDGPNIKLPFFRAQQARQYHTCMNSDSHVYIDVGFLTEFS